MKAWKTCDHAAAVPEPKLTLSNSFEPQNSGVPTAVMHLASKVWCCTCRGQANIDRPVVSFWEHANQLQAQQEEVHLVQEFRERLNYNLQQVRHHLRTPINDACQPLHVMMAWLETWTLGILRVCLAQQ